METIEKQINSNVTQEEKKLLTVTVEVENLGGTCNRNEIKPIVNQVKTTVEEDESGKYKLFH